METYRGRIDPSTIEAWILHNCWDILIKILFRKYTQFFDIKTLWSLIYLPQIHPWELFFHQRKQSHMFVCAKFCRQKKLRRVFRLWRKIFLEKIRTLFARNGSNNQSINQSNCKTNEKKTCFWLIMPLYYVNTPSLVRFLGGTVNFWLFGVFFKWYEACLGQEDINCKFPWGFGSRKKLQNMHW
jgi:hypothetical protein